MEKIDLHIHTNCSDGDKSIYEIIKYAKENECYKIAITDHEIINDYSEIGKEYSIDIINGIEFNTATRGMHILGYGIVDFESVRSLISNLHKENEEVSYLLIENLRKRGFDISLELVREYLSSIGITYDFLDKRHIVKYLIYRGYTKDVWDTYKNLIGRGTNLYLPLKKIECTDIIKVINASGGVSVLAHPETLGLDNEVLRIRLFELVEYGLDGIEVFNGNCLNTNYVFYDTVADNLSLIKTVGSDFHSLDKQSIGIEFDLNNYNNLINMIQYKHKIRRR